MRRAIPISIVLLLFAISAWAQYGGRPQIVRAEYGSGNRWHDVTAQVRSYVSGNVLSFTVSNDALGGDPSAGHVKILRLTLRDSFGRENVVVFHEKDAVNLSLDARADSGGGSGLRITRANYGANGAFYDVTDKLNSLIQSNQLILRVSNDSMGGDPAPNQRKTLTVWYTYNGYDAQASFNEGDTLNLPAPGISSAGSFQILRADYGAANRYRDVTARLNSMIQNGQLSLRVANETMGGDPAEDRRKTLTVWYLSDGRVAEATAAEGDTLNLPGDNGFFQGNLHVLRAQYGVGSSYLDVTDRLNSLIQGDQLNLRVTNDSMGADPDPHRPKQLIVFYIYNGRQGRVVLREKDVLNLPSGGTLWYGGSGNLEILRATYGAGDRGRDVTSLLASEVSDNQLQLIVSNSALGGDPAPDQPKRLRVVYLWQGMRYVTTAAERESLTIP